MLFDTVTNSFTEIDPQPGSLRLATAIGGSRVAFVDGISGNGDIVVYDLASNFTTNLSGGINGPPHSDGNPSVAPDGNSSCLESCNISFSQCDVYAAYWVPPGVRLPAASLPRLLATRQG